MFTIICNDKRVPLDLVEKDYIQIGLEEFIELASDGFTVDEGVYFNLDSLVNKDLYDSLMVSFGEAAKNKLVFYKFKDQNIRLEFVIDADIKIYDDSTVKEIDENAELISEPVETDESEEETTEQVKVKTENDTSASEKSIENVDFEEESTIEEEHIIIDETLEESEDESDNSDKEIVEPIDEEVEKEPVETNNENQTMGGLKVLEDVTPAQKGQLNTDTLSRMLRFDDSSEDSIERDGKIVVFGSFKGGSGKTTTSLMSAYVWGKENPTKKVAVVDMDSQITAFVPTPTLLNFYKEYKNGNKDFKSLETSKAKSEHFTHNVDFFMIPSTSIPELVNDEKFWLTLFDLLIKNYDMIVVDTSPGSQFLIHKPTANVYKLADKLIIMVNASWFTVNSVDKQLKDLSGKRVQNTYKSEENMLDKVQVVVTRASSDPVINKFIYDEISRSAEIVAMFGNLDSIIDQMTWYQDWGELDRHKEITATLLKIMDLKGVKDGKTK